MPITAQSRPHALSSKSCSGTAGGVRNALEALGAEPFVVLYGDILIDEPLASLAAVHRSRARRGDHRGPSSGGR